MKFLRGRRVANLLLRIFNKRSRDVINRPRALASTRLPYNTVQDVVEDFDPIGKGPGGGGNLSRISQSIRRPRSLVIRKILNGCSKETLWYCLSVSW